MFNKAFTLAEILITLGVISVVSAVTLPLVIKKYQQYVALNRLKSTYTLINNAFERAKSDNDLDINNWNMECSSMQSCSNYFSEHYLMPYLKIAKDCRNSTIGNCKFEYRYLNSNEVVFNNYEHRRLILANGTAIDISVILNNGTLKDSRIMIEIYTDNKNKIYVAGKNLFRIMLGGGTSDHGLDRNKFLPYYYYTNVKDRNYYLKNNYNSCSKDKTGLMCLALIMFDGWRMADDYPW